MCLLRINLPNLCPNMNHFDAVDFSECHSEEVMFLLMLSVVAMSKCIITPIKTELAVFELINSLIRPNHQST